MRKNAPRKWIHAILDLLPLFVIPIFAIYTRNESNTFENNIELQIEQNKVVEFNQYVNQVNTNNDFYGLNISYHNNKIVLNGTLDFDESVSLNQFLDYPVYTFPNNFNIENHLIAFNGPSTQIEGIDLFFLLARNLVPQDTYFTTRTYYYNYINDTSVWKDIRIRIHKGTYNQVSFPIQLFDITQMFGVGEEPSTYADFRNYYPNEYYAYNTSEIQLLKNYSTETLNNTDIGSQFLYSVYKPVNEYFNFNHLFNMQGIYDWLQLNLFGGNAPLPVLIVWNIIVYEFFIDLIFLLYSVFMFIIDFATHMIDSFTGRCR